MTHRKFHPQSIDGCFGCKVSAVGFDGGHSTRVTLDENLSETTEHRDGRQSVIVRPKSVRLMTKVRG